MTFDKYSRCTRNPETKIHNMYEISQRRPLREPLVIDPNANHDWSTPAKIHYTVDNQCSLCGIIAVMDQDGKITEWKI